MRLTSAVMPSLCLLLVAVSLGQAQTPGAFTPPGPNLALHKPYTLDPAPNYGDCSLDPKHVVLTDGEYTKGYFWVTQTTVGWVHQRPVIVTVDLGRVEPIAGASYSTAAGVAGVAWPQSILLLVSDDGQQWTAVGDLVALSSQSGAPPATPYRLHRFATGSLQTRGRYLALIVDQTPYTVVDEVEIYRGQDAWLATPPAGPQTKLSPREYQRTHQVLLSMQARMRKDLAQIGESLEKSALPEAEKAKLRTRAQSLTGEVTAQQEVPADFMTILPLNELHTRLYALNAPVLRARGFKGLALWGGHRYDPLQPLSAPAQAPGQAPALSLRVMRNEHRAEVLNLTNATDAALAATIQVTGLGKQASAVVLRQVICTDTLETEPIASALGTKVPGTAPLRVTVPAGTTKQVWLEVDSRDLPAGDYRGALKVTAGGSQPAANVPLSLHVAPLVMPEEFDIAIGGWDETNNKGGYQVTAANMKPLIQNLREHGVNMPWSNPQVMPTPGQYDAEGNMTAPPDFTAWDEWVERWRGARCWGLFPAVGKEFAGEALGTARFNKMVGAWATAWVEHAAKQGIKPAQIMILLVDEPSRPEQDEVIITWARALKATQPELTIWNDPLHVEPEKVSPEFYALTDVLCPNAPRFLNLGKAYQDTIVARQQGGCELWFYSCSGPSKLLDPASYYRGQFWLNLKYGGKGSCYWAFGDEAAFSWNAYVQPRAVYSPLFLSPTEVTDAKQMEAIREGAEDYEYFQQLRARVAELEAKGTRSKLLAEAKALLVTGPEQAVATMAGENLKWATPKDRTVMDRARLRALELLEQLRKL